eukprot:m.23239 g.23239  ORF g.23239 m.23239 type:complete len:264 (-) comp9465_c0_seq1:10-801(-)
MEVVEERHALISNYEALSLVSEVFEAAKQRKDAARSQEMLRTITFEVKQYLLDTPCANQKEEHLAKFLKTMKPSGLTKGEKLQILNLCPRNELGLNLIVEHCPQRFSDAQQGKLLSSIKSSLELTDEDEDEGEEDGDAEAQEDGGEQPGTDEDNEAESAENKDVSRNTSRNGQTQGKQQQHDDEDDADALALRMFQDQLQGLQAQRPGVARGATSTMVEEDDLDDEQEDEAEDEETRHQDDLDNEFYSRMDDDDEDDDYGNDY